MQLFPWNPTELLPHRPPMLLIDEIIDWGAQHASAALTIRPDTLFLEGDRVPAHIGIEYMAQTCGAWAGAVARESGLAPRRGYLLGARAFRWHRPAFLLGERLVIGVRLTYRDAALGRFLGRIEIDGVLAAESDLTVYEPPENGELPA